VAGGCGVERALAWSADTADCALTGKFASYKLHAIANLSKNGVVVQTDVGEPFPDATMARRKADFAFLERLCQL
jgi:hypothetical protein